jgi:hypothetical protein
MARPRSFAAVWVNFEDTLRGGSAAQATIAYSAKTFLTIAGESHENPDREGTVSAG